MNRNFRLTRSNDFQRVKQNGKSYAHSLIVLIKSPNPVGTLRIGVSAGKAIGNAVTRNRVKRRMRASLNVFIRNIQPGWDLVFLARKPIVDAAYDEVIAAVRQILKRAEILMEESGKE